MDVLISVVVPIYKVESYLSRCIDSILNQTYDKIQIILVDDGSPDRCGIICDEYARKDRRIQVIHKDNGGLSDARNAGIEIAKGKYITFIDSDDYVAINYIEELLRAMSIARADMSVVDVEVVNDNKPYFSNAIEGSIRTVSGQEAIKLALRTDFRQSAWGKLYKREIFDSVRFPEGMLYEDLAIVYQVLALTDIIAISNAKLYKYEVRQGSIMQTSFNINQYKSLYVIDEAMDFVCANYPQLESLSNGRRVYSYFTVLRRLLNSPDRKNYYTIIKELKGRIDKYSKGLIWNKEIKKSLKMRLIAYSICDRLYLRVEEYLYKRIEGINA